MAIIGNIPYFQTNPNQWVQNPNLLRLSMRLDEVLLQPNMSHKCSLAATISHLRKLNVCNSASKNARLHKVCLRVEVGKSFSNLRDSRISTGGGALCRSRHTMQAWVEINSCSATCLFGFRLCQEWPCSRWFALDQPRLTVNSQKYPKVARVSSIKRKTLNCWQLGIMCISANTSVYSIPSEANLQVHNFWVAAGTVWRMSIWARDPSRQAIPDVLSIGMDLFDDLHVGIVAFVKHAE